MKEKKTHPQIIMRRLPLLDHAEPEEPRIGGDETFHALKQRRVQDDGVDGFFAHYCLRAVGLMLVHGCDTQKVMYYWAEE